MMAEKENGFPWPFLCLTRLIYFHICAGAYIIVAHTFEVGHPHLTGTIIFVIVLYSSSYLNLWVWEYAHGHIIADKSWRSIRHAAAFNNLYVLVHI